MVLLPVLEGVLVAVGERLVVVDAEGLVLAVTEVEGVGSALLGGADADNYALSNPTGSATASLPKPSCVTKASAALTSSSRFSMRSWPSLSAL